MKDYEITKGERFDLEVTDIEGVSARLLVSPTAGDTAVIDVTAPFTDGKAYLTALGADTDIAIGSYVYEIRVYDEDNEYITLGDNCEDGVCVLPKLTVCAGVEVA